jgi:hypothetical protein
MDNPFVGAWKLISAEFRDRDGKRFYPFGILPTGMIVYTPGGRMSVHIVASERASFASGDLFGGTTQETKAAFDGYLGFFGSYTFDESARTVTHHVEGSWFPNWAGGDQVRDYHFAGGRLTLRMRSIPSAGGPLTGVLVWDRAG